MKIPFKYLYFKYTTHEMLRFMLIGFFASMIIYKAYLGQYESMIDKAVVLCLMVVNNILEFKLKISEAWVKGFLNGTVKKV